MVDGFQRASVGLVLLLAGSPAYPQGPDQSRERPIAQAREKLGTHSPAATGEPLHTAAARQVTEKEAPPIDLSVTYTADVMHNARGALRRGTRHLDNLDLTLQIDAGRAFGWPGMTLFAHGLYNNGQTFTQDVVGAAQGVSNLETGVRAARLFEAWIEQCFASCRGSVKFGLYDLNSEFDAVEAAALFINPSHGIGPDLAQSGRNGPSIFPVTSLAVRGAYQLNDRWLVRAAILDGVPGDPDRPRRTAIKLGGGEGALGIVELNHSRDHTRLGAGYWRYTGDFENLAAIPENRRSNDGLYAFAERRLTQERADAKQGLAGWVRLGFADASLNSIKRYLGGGLNYTGPLPRREEDQAGLVIGWAEFSAPHRRSSAFRGEPLNARELIVEATYRAAVTSWLTLQPDLQYVVNPGGRSATPNALVLGLRAELSL